MRYRGVPPAPKSDKQIIKASIHEAIEKFGQDEFAAALTEVTAEILAMYREQKEEEKQYPKESTRFEEIQTQVLDALNKAYLIGAAEAGEKSSKYSTTVCCGEYDTCNEACTPRGIHLGKASQEPVQEPTKEECNHSWNRVGHRYNVHLKVADLYMCSECGKSEWR